MDKGVFDASPVRVPWQRQSPFQRLEALPKRQCVQHSAGCPPGARQLNLTISPAWHACERTDPGGKTVARQVLDATHQPPRGATLPCTNGLLTWRMDCLSQ